MLIISTGHIGAHIKNPVSRVNIQLLLCYENIYIYKGTPGHRDTNITSSREKFEKQEFIFVKILQKSRFVIFSFSLFPVSQCPSVPLYSTLLIIKDLIVSNVCSTWCSNRCPKIKMKQKIQKEKRE